MQMYSFILATQASEGVELELRLGRQDGASFRSGVHAEDFQLLCTYLGEQRANEFAASYAHMTDYVYEGDVRIVYDERKKMVIDKMTKKRLDTFAVPSDLPYDIRAARATERHFPAEDLPDAVPGNYKHRRNKDRCSFTQKAGGFRVDATKVRTPPSDMTFEVEIELDVKRLRDVAPNSLHDAVRACVADCLRLLHDFFAAVKSKRAAIHEVMYQNIVKSKRGEFPGPMPAALSRRHFVRLQSEEYMVSEKSDGIRYLLFVNGSGAYLIGRTCTPEFVAGGERLVKLYADNGQATLLDGELVVHIVSRKLVYLVFDAVLIRGENVGARMLLERLTAVRERIIQPWRAAFQHDNSVPFHVINKNFYPKAQLGRVFSAFVTQQQQSTGDGKPVRYWLDDKRHHRTKGVILTPVNAPYATDLPVLKWQYPEFVSLDFKLRYRDDRRVWVLLGATDQSDDLEIMKLDMAPADREPLEQAMAGHEHGGDGLIVELRYDEWTGMWRFVGARPDKLRASHVRAMLSTMETIAEDVTYDELVYRLGQDPTTDKWLAQLKS